MEKEIEEKELENVNGGNVLDDLKGKILDVNVTGEDGKPGANVDIRVR